MQRTIPHKIIHICRRPANRVEDHLAKLEHPQQELYMHMLFLLLSPTYIYHGAIRPGCRHGTKNGFATPIEEVHAILELDGQRVQGQEDEFVL